MPGFKCPICGSTVTAVGGELPKSFPFCGDRCRNADLGRWLDERYAVPVETNRVASQAIEEIERCGKVPENTFEKN